MDMKAYLADIGLCESETVEDDRAASDDGTVGEETLAPQVAKAKAKSSAKGVARTKAGGREGKAKAKAKGSAATKSAGSASTKASEKAKSKSAPIKPPVAKAEPTFPEGHEGDSETEDRVGRGWSCLETGGHTSTCFMRQETDTDGKRHGPGDGHRVGPGQDQEPQIRPRVGL